MIEEIEAGAGRVQGVAVTITVTVQWNRFLKGTGAEAGGNTKMTGSILIRRNRMRIIALLTLIDSINKVIVIQLYRHICFV